jgi:integrase
MPLIRIERSGTAKWYVRVQPIVGGVKLDRRRCVGAKKPSASELARIEAELYAAADAEPVARTAPLSGARAPGLVGDYLAWLSARRSRGHAVNVARTLRQAQEALGSDPARWTRSAIEGFVTDGRLARGWATGRRAWSARGANAALQSIGGMLRWAVSGERLPSDAAAGIARVREAAREPRWLDRREIVRALRACRTYDATRSRMGGWLERAVRIALGTGLRRGELRTLAWADVDLDADTLRVRPEKAKSRRGRTIPLTRLAREALVATPAAERKGPVVPEVARYDTALKKALRAADIDGADWHTLRHTYASHMVLRGVPLTAVRELLGHSSIQVTMIYAHLAPSHVADAVRRTGF